VIQRNHRSVPLLSYRVYVVENDAGRYYIGISDDVTRRLNEHNSGVSRWTRGKGPRILLWASDSSSLSDARPQENKLKRQGRGSGFYSITGLIPPSS
jgi:predicted GIY-YIG superfamily endonuclease